MPQYFVRPLFLNLHLLVIASHAWCSVHVLILCGGLLCAQMSGAIVTSLLHMQESNVVLHNLPPSAESAWEVPEQERQESREPAPV